MAKQYCFQGYSGSGEDSYFTHEDVCNQYFVAVKPSNNGGATTFKMDIYLEDKTKISVDKIKDETREYTVDEWIKKNYDDKETQLKRKDRGSNPFSNGLIVITNYNKKAYKLVDAGIGTAKVKWEPTEVHGNQPSSNPVEINQSTGETCEKEPTTWKKYQPDPYYYQPDPYYAQVDDAGHYIQGVDTVATVDELPCGSTIVENTGGGKKKRRKTKRRKSNKRKSKKRKSKKRKSKKRKSKKN